MPVSYTHLDVYKRQVHANNNYFNNRYRGRWPNYNSRNYRHDSYHREEGPQRSMSAEQPRFRDSDEERRPISNIQHNENVESNNNNDGNRGNGYQMCIRDRL